MYGSFTPPADEPAGIMHEAIAAGLLSVGAARGLPAMGWFHHRDWSGSRRWRVYGRPVVDDLAESITVAQQWALALGLAELDRDQMRAELAEQYWGVRHWTGLVYGFRIIILTETTTPDERHTVTPDPAGVEHLRATMTAGRLHPDRSNTSIGLAVNSSAAVWPVRSLRIMTLVGAIAAVGGVLGASSFAVADYRPWLALQAIAAGVVAATALAGLRTVAGARARGADPRSVAVTATAWSTASMAGMTMVAAVPALGWVAGSPVQPWTAALSAACAAGLVVTTVGAGLSLRPSAIHAALGA